MKKYVCGLIMVLACILFPGIESRAVVDSYYYKAGQANYDKNGEISFGYSDRSLYEAVYVNHDLSKYTLNQIYRPNKRIYDWVTNSYKTGYALIVPYGTESLRNYLPISVLEHGASERIAISWPAVPEGAFSHMEGYEFTLHGTGEGYSMILTVSVLPVEALNQKRPAENLTFTSDGTVYSNGTYTGSFYTYPEGKTFVLSDGSRLADGTALIGGAYYTFDENAFCYFNEYRGGYYYGEDGKRAEGVTYQWDKDGDYEVYMDSEGNRLSLAYALIDGTIHFFDGLGHAWQTFDYPAYSLNGDNVLVGVPGEFDNTGKQKIINKITEIRQDAVDSGIIKKEDYVVPKWSYGLERGAIIRACEANLFKEISHSRPASSAADLAFDGIKDCSESCLAWGTGSILGAISLYYSEKENLLEKNGGVTGHYTAMLYSEYIGSASVYTPGFGSTESYGSSNAYCTASSKQKDGVISEEKVKFSPYSIQLIEVGKSRLSVVKNRSVVSHVRGASIYTYNLDGLRKRTGEGTITKKNGKRYFKYPDGTYAEDKWIQTEGKIYYCDDDGVLKEYKDGVEYTIDGIIYKLHDLKLKDGIVSGGTAEAYKLKKASYYTSVYDGLWFGDAEFPVTVIAASMAKGNKNIYNLYIGKNVASIGKDAFYGCSSISNMYIYSKKLNDSNVQKAFQKTSANMKVYVPKNKVPAYKKLLQKKGVSKKAQINKIN